MRVACLAVLTFVLLFYPRLIIFLMRCPLIGKYSPIIYTYSLLCLLLVYPFTLGSACAFYILIVDRVSCVTISPSVVFVQYYIEKKKSRQNASLIFFIFRLRLPVNRNERVRSPGKQVRVGMELNRWHGWCER